MRKQTLVVEMLGTVDGYGGPGVERATGHRTIPEGQARTAILRRRYQAAVEGV